jgi:hypothetical protein
MKTEDLIVMLAANAAPVDRMAVVRRFSFSLGGGMLITGLLLVLWLGASPGLPEMAALPMFWVKLLFSLGVATVALYAVVRLALPGMKAKAAPKLLLILLATLWALAAHVLINAAPAERSDLIFGQTWLYCVLIIPLLSIPVFVAAFWALKGMAPTRLALTGASAGLLAGAASATVYALYCPELAAPFIAVWYVLGMVIPAVIGAYAGTRYLRW